jgi:D-alanyl-D-alanine carboxypeptidase/D-alanyl-D-alanine-endopeptidase (penicillin-binding protein 4)
MSDGDGGRGRHFAKGNGGNGGGGSGEHRGAGPPPPRLRESDRLRERMRAQQMGGPGSGELPPPTRRPDPPLTERRLPPWALPTVLGAVGVLAAVGSFLLNQSAGAAALDADTPTTPVLSARRVPELIAAPVANARLQTDLSNWISQSPADSCLAVQAGGETVFSQKAAEPYAGASTQKLVTATAALLSMGPDARLDTVASTATPPAGGVIDGDLFIVGAGDPLLTTGPYAAQLFEGRPPVLVNDPQRLVDAIKAAGVTRINGSVVGDGSRYDTQRFHPAWPERYQPQNVVGNLDALVIDDGYESFPATFQGEGARVPAADGAAHAALKITTLLREAGVQVDGAPRSGAAPADTTLTMVATLPSPPLIDIIGEMLVESDDDTAEMLLKEVGRRESGVGSWDAGVAAATRLLGEAGVDMSGVEIVDGSGLSYDNRLTCNLLMGLITRPDTGPLLVEHASVAGENGTLLEPFEGTPVDGRMHAKTGTLNTVTALAGRVDPLQGGSLMFAYVANAPSISAADAGQWRRSLADLLVAYPRGVDIEALLPAGTTPAGDEPASGSTATSTTAAPAVPAAAVVPGRAAALAPPGPPRHRRMGAAGVLQRDVR